MRIGFLCKRVYMSKDVIDDRYARLYEIPHQLARLGHDVLSLCLSYRGRPEGSWEHEVPAGRLRWRSRSIGPVGFGLLGYPRAALAALREFQPDLLIGASDIPHAALTAWLATRLGVPFALDLYDNFEGFGQGRIPGFVTALRSSARSASLVLTTSEPLRKFVLETYAPAGEVVAMPSTIDRKVFKQRDKLECRQSLGLPLDALLVGTAGGLYREKGIIPLYQAWEETLARRANVHLVLAGPQEQGTPAPVGDRVHYLGNLKHESVAELFCALDVGVISILDTPFGRFSFPQKAYEMLACGTPMVAARVGAMANLFNDSPSILFEAGSSVQLAQAIEHQLAEQFVPEIQPQDWSEVLAEIEPRLRGLAHAEVNADAARGIGLTS